LRLGPAAKAQLAELISRAAPLSGDFFRSVAFRHFHPDDVISGEGTRLHGGRFVPVGVPAVYASLEEDTALRGHCPKESFAWPRVHRVGRLPQNDLYPADHYSAEWAIIGEADFLCTRDRDFYTPEVLAYLKERKRWELWFWTTLH
jgi:RES domain